MPWPSPPGRAALRSRAAPAAGHGQAGHCASRARGPPTWPRGAAAALGLMLRGLMLRGLKEREVAVLSDLREPLPPGRVDVAPRDPRPPPRPPPPPPHPPP